MTDRSAFEARLEARLRARAAVAARPFDAGAIAHQAMEAGARRPRLRWFEWASPGRPAFWLAVALLLAIALLGAVVAGALLRQPLPISHSTPANGWVAISAPQPDFGGGENGDIFVVNGGTAPRRIIGSDGDGMAHACPMFSPDGRRLAYGEARASGPVTTYRGVWPVADRAVVVVGIDDRGDASQPIARTASLPDAGEIPCPEWSPDGRFVAFRAARSWQHGTPVLAGDAVGSQEIAPVGAALWVADASSGATIEFPVGGSPWGQRDFEWSRDGSRIAVAEPGQIRVIRVADGTSYVIPVHGTWVGATPRSLGWTAGDQRIVYTSTDLSGDEVALWVVDAAGANPIALTPDPPNGAVASQAVVSPDGHRVAYLYGSPTCCAAGDSTPRLRITDLDGSNAVDLSPCDCSFLDGLQWSPDGQQLLFDSRNVVYSVGRWMPALIYSTGELDLEWTGSELTWQPVSP